MKKRKLLRTAFFLIFLGIMLFAAWKLYGIWQEYREGIKTYDDLADRYTKPVGPGAAEDQMPAIGEGGGKTIPISVSFDALMAECPDVVAWLYCEGTPINYPIVQGEDNEYYMYRLMDGKYNKSGTLFMDCRNQADFSDWNTIIYGHNMKNGSMFGTLLKYQDPKYYEEHPVMYLLTPEKHYEIKLVSAYVTPADSETYTIPETQAEKEAMLLKAYRTSSFISGVQPLREDRMITLSTCAYDLQDARYVVLGLLRELPNGGGSAAETVE